MELVQGNGIPSQLLVMDAPRILDLSRFATDGSDQSHF